MEYEHMLLGRWTRVCRLSVIWTGWRASVECEHMLLGRWARVCLLFVCTLLSLRRMSVCVYVLWAGLWVSMCLCVRGVCPLMCPGYVGSALDRYVGIGHGSDGSQLEYQWASGFSLVSCIVRAPAHPAG